MSHHETNPQRRFTSRVADYVRFRPDYPAALFDCLRKETDFSIGDNEPYSGRLVGDSMFRHGTSRGLAHALIEIRQDQIRDHEGQQEWAGRLADILTRIMANPELAAELSVIRK